MKNLLIRWWNTWQRARWEKTQIRYRIADQEGQDHLERQRKGIHDIPPGGGASF